jgi:SAM-dependent methyltransferase
MINSYLQISQKTTCPVCFSTNARLLWSVTSSQAAQHFILKEKEPQRFFDLVSHIETLWGQITCEVLQCNDCEFCFCNPFVSGDKKFYDLAYDRSGYPDWNWEHQLTYEALRGLVSTDFRLLEIGAGDGSFIRRITPVILPKQNIMCLEFSEYGCQRIRELGVACSSDDIRNINKSEFQGYFDIVCMFQVLEHMGFIDLLFEKLNWLMKKNADLFISVPNPQRLMFFELNGALLDMPPNHVGKWNRNTFEIMAKRTGFHIEKYMLEDLKYLSMAKQFLKYRFLRKSQVATSLANRITRIKQRKLRLPLQAIGALIELPTSVSSILRIDKTLGTSQWVHLKKQ